MILEGLQDWAESAPPEERGSRDVVMQRMIDARLNESTRLFLYERNVSSLPPQIGNLRALTELIFNAHQLTTLPAEIGELDALTRLDLNYNLNQLTLPPQIGNLNALTRLDLYANQLTELPAEIGKLVALTLLDLEGNQLTTLPREIVKLAALTHLNLRNNNQLIPSPDLLDILSELETKGCVVQYPQHITIEVRTDRAESRLQQASRTTALESFNPKSHFSKLDPETIGKVLEFTDATLLSKEQKEQVYENTRQGVQQTDMYRKHVQRNSGDAGQELAGAPSPNAKVKESNSLSYSKEPNKTILGE